MKNALNKFAKAQRNTVGAGIIQVLMLYKMKV